MRVSLLTASEICETIRLQGCENMDKSLINVYEKLAAAEEQIKAGKTKDAAEGLRVSREKLRLATERLASEVARAGNQLRKKIDLRWRKQGMVSV